MKIRRLSEFQGRLVFPNFDTTLDALMGSFLATVWEVFTDQSHGMDFGLKGPRPIFPRGKLALMFLKHYTGCSDRKWIEHLNSNVHYQIFCDTVVPVGSPYNE